MAAVSNEKLWIVLNRAHQAIDECLVYNITARGIATSDFIVLEVLLHSAPLAALAISEKTRLAATSVEITISRLRQQKLICAQTRRANEQESFVLTDQGKNLIEWMFAEHLKDIEGIFGILSSEKRFDLYQLLRKVGRNAESRRTMPGVDAGGGLTPWQLRRATEFVRQRMADPITTKEIAASVELSDSYFRRAFKNATGVTPHKWLLGARIKHAQKLLKETAMPMSEIASVTGFGDQSHFSRTFQRTTGVSPRIWQRDHNLR
ncbi:MAG: helix-turn-helix domain-containing protein [Edaphobacter sp.]|uniref:helix-turn-helix domain-containing protein n=1 Tax=Edaphobacter sp. TaxID=1934404 RepID=UPI00238C68DF|nr:helix-turn-helix domain-containing protein [Edaphobacter sp.]MDE1175720.1 helix-turn-helix domain-containing protein [Edaphobacter sp.]